MEDAPYSKLLGQFLEEPVLASLANNFGDVPFLDVGPHVADLPFPPALIPIWSSTSGVQIGLWSHCLIRARPPTFVKYFGNGTITSGDIVIEIARSFRQLVKVFSLREMVGRECLDPDLVRFCSRFEIDLQEIWSLAEEHGDDDEILRSDPDFRNRCPLSLAFESSEYNGTFPFSKNNFELPHASLYEVHSWFKNGVPNYSDRYRLWLLSDTPEHLKESPNKSLLFHEYLEQGEFSMAWLLLNRSGWTVKDLRMNLAVLAERSKDPQMELMTDCWTSWNWDDTLVLN